MATLQSIRGSAGTWIVRLLFVLLIASFAFWGIGDIFRSDRREAIVATVGGIKITRGDLDQALAQRLSGLREEHGELFDREALINQGVIEVVIEELVIQTLFGLAAQDQGLLFSNELILDLLRNDESFHDENGQFSPTLVRRIVAASGMSEGDFIALIGERMSRELLVSTLTRPISAPEMLVDVLMRRRSERRRAEVLLVDHADLPMPTEPDESEIAQYHQEHQTRFMKPEYRALSVLFADSSAGDIDISQGLLERAYEDRKDSFYQPERRTVEHVLVDTREQAAALLDKTREHGGDLTQALLALEGLVIVGRATRAELGNLGDRIFAAEQGKIAGPVETADGWHVFSVTEIVPIRPAQDSVADDQVDGGTPDVNTASDETDAEQTAAAAHSEEGSEASERAEAVPENAIPQPERRSVEQVVLTSEDEVRQLLEEAQGLGSLRRALLERSELEVVAIEDATRQELGELGEQVFTLAEGEVGELVRSALGWHVMAVTAIAPEHTPGFDEVRAELLESLQRDRALDRLFTRINQVEDLLAGRVPLEEIAAILDIKLFQIGPLDRNGNLSTGSRLGEPAELVSVLDRILQQGFSLQEGEHSAVTEASGGESFFVVRLDNITDPEPQVLEQVRDMIVSELEHEWRREQVREHDQQLVKRLRDGESLAAVASNDRIIHGVLDLARDQDLSSPLPLTTDRSVRLPEYLLDSLFTLAPGEVADGRLAGGGTLILRLSEIVPLETTNSDEQRDEIRREVTQSLTEDLLFQFIDALKQRYQVHVDTPQRDSFL